MTNKQGFYSVEPLNDGMARIALVWHNTKLEEFGNTTISKEVIKVKRFETFSENDIKKVAEEFMNEFDLESVAVSFENLNYHTYSLRGVI